MDMAVRKNLASSRVRKSGRTFSLEKGFGGRDKVKRQADQSNDPNCRYKTDAFKMTL